jgi:hypothetical protein
MKFTKFDRFQLIWSMGMGVIIMFILRIFFHLSFLWAMIWMFPIVAVVSYIDVEYFYPYVKKKYFIKEK